MKNAIIIAICVAIISGTISGIVASTIQNQSQDAEINELKNLVLATNVTATESQKQTDIMRDDFEVRLENLEKKPEISALIKFYGDSTITEDYIISLSNKEYTYESTVVSKAIELKRDEIAKFEIILTNIGEDTALIDSFNVRFFYVHEFGSSSGFLKGDTIDVILEPNSEPYIIQYSTEIDILPDQGELVFIILYDRDVVKSTPIKFKIVEE